MSLNTCTYAASHIQHLNASCYIPLVFPSPYVHVTHSIPVLPKLFSTATQFLEQPSIATKKVVLKRKKYFYLLLNIIKKTRSYLVMRRVRLVPLFPVSIFAVVVVESRIRIIYWGRYAIYYVPYSLPF
jgi:hypothetical protein